MEGQYYIGEESDDDTIELAPSSPGVMFESPSVQFDLPYLEDRLDDVKEGLYMLHHVAMDDLPRCIRMSPRKVVFSKAPEAKRIKRQCGICEKDISTGDAINVVFNKHVHMGCLLEVNKRVLAEPVLYEERDSCIVCQEEIQDKESVAMCEGCKTCSIMHLQCFADSSDKMSRCAICRHPRCL